MAVNDDSQRDGIASVAHASQDVSRPGQVARADGSAAGSRTGRRRLMTILRVLVSAALLVLVLRRGSILEVAELLRRSAD